MAALALADAERCMQEQEPENTAREARVPSRMGPAGTSKQLRKTCMTF